MAHAHGSKGGMRTTGHTTLVLALGTGDEVSTMLQSQGSHVLDRATLSVAQIAHLPDMIREFLFPYYQQHGANEYHLASQQH